MTDAHPHASKGTRRSMRKSGKKTAEARARLRKEAEEEKTFMRGLGFCSSGVGSTRATVGGKNGKMSRSRPLRYDWKYQPEAFNPWKIEAKILTEQ